MSKLPESVELVGQHFAIEEVDKDAGVLRDGDAIGVGRSMLTQQRLLIGGEQGVDQTRDTLLHEILHALVGIVGMFDKAKDEERVVAGLTPLLLDALRRNPKVVAYLVAA